MMQSNPIPRTPAIIIACCVLSTSNAGCAPTDSSPADRPSDLRSRQVVDAPSWTTTVLRGGSPDDTSLVSPSRLSATKDGVTLIDAYPMQIKRYGHDGASKWVFGREGGGPGEFRHLTDLKVDPLGRTWVLDAANARMTVIDPDGKTDVLIPLRNVGGYPHELIPLRTGGALILTSGQAKNPLVVVDREGKVVSRLAFPFREFQNLHYLAAQQVTGSDPVTGRWVSAYRISDGFTAFQDTTWGRDRGWFVEPAVVPRVVRQRQNGGVSTTFSERPNFSALSVTLSPERVHILYGGRSEDRGRIIDSYSLRDLQYVESFRLPAPVLEIAWFEGGFYTIRNDPEPELAFVRPANIRVR